MPINLLANLVWDSFLSAGIYLESTSGNEETCICEDFELNACISLGCRRPRLELLPPKELWACRMLPGNLTIVFQSQN